MQVSVLTRSAFVLTETGAYYASGSVEFGMGTPLQVKGPRELCFFSGVCKGYVNNQIMMLEPRTRHSPAFPGFEYDSEIGARNVKVSLEFSPDLQQEMQEILVYWNGGGVFVPQKTDTEIKVLSCYLELPDRPPAVILCRASKGKALLSSVHPEHPLTDRVTFCWQTFFRALLIQLDFQVSDHRAITPTAQYLFSDDHRISENTKDTILKRFETTLHSSFRDQDTFVIMDKRLCSCVHGDTRQIIVGCRPASCSLAFHTDIYFAKLQTKLLGRAALVADTVTSTQSLLERSVIIKKAVTRFHYRKGIRFC